MRNVHIRMGILSLVLLLWLPPLSVGVEAAVAAPEPSATTVSEAAKALPAVACGKACRRVIRARIRKNLPGVENLRLVFGTQLKRWLAAAAPGAEVEVLSFGSWNRKSGQLPVQFALRDANGRLIRRWFKVEVFGRQPVLLAARDLRRGEPVRASDFVSHLVDCRKLGNDVVSRLPADGLYQLSCNLAAGQPLPARRLKPFRLIRRGELVRVRLEQGGIRITTRGVAMNNGALREVIAVRNPVSRKIYQARVVGNGEVVVVY